jgi:hypothetical protein
MLDEYPQERVQQIVEMAGYYEIFWRESGSIVPSPHPPTYRQEGKGRGIG